MTFSEFLRKTAGRFAAGVAGVAVGRRFPTNSAPSSSDADFDLSEHGSPTTADEGGPQTTPTSDRASKKHSPVRIETRKAFMAARHVFGGRKRCANQSKFTQAPHRRVLNPQLNEPPQLPEFAEFEDISTIVDDALLKTHAPSPQNGWSVETGSHFQHEAIKDRVAVSPAQLRAEVRAETFHVKAPEDHENIGLTERDRQVNQQVQELELDTEIRNEVGETELQPSGDEDEDLEDDVLEMFRPVMNALDVERLGQFALMVRLCLDFELVWELSSLPTLTCKVSTKPMCGAYNLVYELKFSDGVSWIARIPGHGTPARFGPLDATKMESEYRTMEYIRRNTSIPIPQTHYWDTACARIGVPFALMSFVDGEALNNVWHQKLSGQQRLNVLASIAQYMSELQNLSFDRIGTLRFDDQSQCREVGDQIVLQPRGFTPWHSTVTKQVHMNVMDAFWDYIDEDEEDMRHRSAFPILRLALQSMPDYLTREVRFFLTPVDLNYQNIFVDPEGKIISFIDWDNVYAESTTCGYGRYPSWITRDWDPCMYAYNEDAPDDESVQEEPPETLSQYRQHYLAEFAKYAANFPGYDPRMTKLSHIVEAITIAIGTTFSRPGIINKLFDHAFNGNAPFNLADYADDYVAGDTSEKDAMLKQAFATMWHAEWEKAGCESQDVLELGDADSPITTTTSGNTSCKSSETSTCDKQHHNESTSLTIRSALS